MLSRLPIIFRKFSSIRKSGLRLTIRVAFGKYLLLTNVGSAGILMFLGDLIQQEIESANKTHTSISGSKYDSGRLVRMFVAGLALGPMHHYYYRYINMVWPKRGLDSVFKKILADQFFMSPVCICQFFYTMGLLEQKTLQECTKELQAKFLTVYKVDWCVWPPVQFFNFYLIPARYQVLYINVMTMLYDVFLSYIKHRHGSEAQVK